MTTLTEHDVYYLRSIERQLQALKEALGGQHPSLSSEALHDTLNWIDAFIIDGESARVATEITMSTAAAELVKERARGISSAFMTSLPDNKHGLPEGHMSRREFVMALRSVYAKPAAVHFLADMLE